MSFVKQALLASLRGGESWKAAALLVPVSVFSALLFFWCHTTNSIALTSFAYISLFDIGSLVMCLVSEWASKQKPTPIYSYGFERTNVLSVFTVTILLILTGINLLKHSAERIFEPPVVKTDQMLLAVCVGLAVHTVVSYGISNRALLHCTRAAAPNWVQTTLKDVGHSVCTFYPPLGRLLLRFNPLALLVVGCTCSVLLTILLIDLDELYLADVACTLFNSFLICGTMLPLSIYSAKILLQTSPEHILPVIEKSLREASTLDGVLELKNEHFWTVSFGVYAGSLYVRVRRDANEQEVLSLVTSRLSCHLDNLTVQVVKDEWSLSAHPPPLPPMPSPGSGRNLSPPSAAPVPPLFPPPPSSSSSSFTTSPPPSTAPKTPATGRTLHPQALSSPHYLHHHHHNHQSTTPHSFQTQVV